jgi:hypothetical protein
MPNGLASANQRVAISAHHLTTWKVSNQPTTTHLLVHCLPVHMFVYGSRGFIPTDAAAACQAPRVSKSTLLHSPQSTTCTQTRRNLIFSLSFSGFQNMFDHDPLPPRLQTGAIVLVDDDSYSCSHSETEKKILLNCPKGNLFYAHERKR